MELKEFLKLVDTDTRIIIQNKNDEILVNDFCKTRKMNLKNKFKKLQKRTAFYFYAPDKNILKIFIS